MRFLTIPGLDEEIIQLFDHLKIAQEIEASIQRHIAKLRKDAFIRVRGVSADEIVRLIPPSSGEGDYTLSLTKPIAGSWFCRLNTRALSAMLFRKPKNEKSGN